MRSMRANPNSTFGLGLLSRMRSAKLQILHEGYVPLKGFPSGNLEAALKFRSARTPRYSPPPVRVIKLTKEREIDP
jgi:hypothetical protein